MCGPWGDYTPRANVSSVTDTAPASDLTITIPEAELPNSSLYSLRGSGVLIYYETGSHRIAQADLTLLILLPHLPKYRAAHSCY